VGSRLAGYVVWLRGGAGTVATWRAERCEGRVGGLLRGEQD
jgi:hypothetical protein